MDGHAFTEVDGQPVWPELDEYDEVQRLAAVKEYGEVAVVRYFKDHEGVWRPGSITTRSKIEKGPYAGQWHGSEFDANYSRSSAALYVHNSGGGSVCAEIPKFTHAKDLPCRIWLADDVEPTIGKRLATAKQMRRRGVIRVHGPAPAPFLDTIEGDTFWCEACDDHLKRDDGQTCARCRDELHVHAGRTLFVATGEIELDEDGNAAEDIEHGLVPGCYRILKFPYYADGMIEGHVIKHALERVADLPDGLDTDGYPCGHLCDGCSAKILKEPG